MPSRRRVVILGSTGSIGTQAIEVISSHPDRFEVVGLVSGSNEDLLRRQAADLNVERVGLGSQAALELACLSEADVVLNAIVGAAGLRASIAALEDGKTLALANKESLVAGGEACAIAARRGGGRIVPVDSEHAALAQCLRGFQRDAVARIVLTASGGPFRTRADLSDVTREEALAHPTWSMGPKVTVDSATLMNKGLEVIEAHHLFGFDFPDIGVVVHPQSVVHGLVELVDGATVLQAAPTDMRIPILGALSAPEIVPGEHSPVDLAALGELCFEPVDHQRFPALELAYRAGAAGGTHPCALNAANEVVVQAFLAGSIPFTAIPAVVESVLDRHEGGDADTLDAVLEADERARTVARALIDEAPTVDKTGNG
ncbi:MAG: 1-deoxy-D-xylulose-5-phosphate reductoisomerase [Actinomycetota bacterium]|nr:1-deoxy-D-xylulose-5-phosphate reductoisomerase [Actinomycetota bacterium]